MSADEDTELRDLVAHTLETNGVLGKIRAQLRASVFLALEEQESVKNKTPFLNQELKQYVSTYEGRCVTGLVKEFLQFYNLDYTLTVFESESGLGDKYQGRGHLAREMDIIEGSESVKHPLLAEVTRRCKTSANLHTDEGDLTAAQVEEAKKKFDEYDDNHNGQLEKDEMRHLFSDMFPGFHRNMLDRYVNDELKSADKDFSQTIDFEEFLGMYKRLFVLCKSVVANQTVDIRVLSDNTIPMSNKSHTAGPTRHLPATSSKSVDLKNKKNEEDSKAQFMPKSADKQKSSSKGMRPVVSPRDATLSAASSVEDPFFDEPVPSEKELHFSSQDLSGLSANKSPPPKSTSEDEPEPLKAAKTDTAAAAANNNDKPTGGMSSLAGLPSLKADGGGGLSSLAGLPSLDSKKASEETKKTEDSSKADDSFEALFKKKGREDSYDEDFESSNLSPIGQTPRSARSDNNVKSIDEDISEDIEDEDDDDDDDDFSGADDLLKSDPSAKDDLTTDRTVSPAEESAMFDYVEEILP